MSLGRACSAQGICLVSVSHTTTPKLQTSLALDAALVSRTFSPTVGGVGKEIRNGKSFVDVAKESHAQETV